MNITLVIIPGSGMDSLTLNSGTTVSQLIAARDLQGRGITIDGRTIKAEQYDTTVLQDGMEVFATANVKGA